MELQIIRAQEFIRLGPRGHFDLNASKAVLAVLAGACLKRGIRQALLDLRALHPGPKPVFSPGDLVTLVNTFRQIGFTHRQRLAVLYRSDPHHRANMFASIARLRGWSVKAFDSFEDAVTWLSRAEQEPSEVEADSTARARRVPVRQLEHLNASSKPKSSAQPTIQVKSTPGPKQDAIQPKARIDQGRPLAQPWPAVRHRANKNDPIVKCAGRPLTSNPMRQLNLSRKTDKQTT